MRAVESPNSITHLWRQPADLYFLLIVFGFDLLYIYAFLRPSAFNTYQPQDLWYYLLIIALLLSVNYRALSRAANRTILRVCPPDLQIHAAPLSLTRKVSIPLDQIQSLFVEEKAARWLPFIPRREYQVIARLKGDREQRLMDHLPNEAAAKDYQKQIEKALRSARRK